MQLHCCINNFALSSKQYSQEIALQLATRQANGESVNESISNAVNNIAEGASKSSQLAFLSGSWEGTYACQQGLTSLRLTIDARSENNIDAVFYFYAHPSNPSVPSGSFRMEGTYQAFNSREVPGLLDLRGATWINRPSNYMTVDLRGNVFVQENRSTGKLSYI
jgi:hypothetical protein